MTIYIHVCTLFLYLCFYSVSDVIVVVAVWEYNSMCERVQQPEQEDIVVWEREYDKGCERDSLSVWEDIEVCVRECNNVHVWVY